MYIQKTLRCGHANCNEDLPINVMSNTSINRRSNKDKISIQSELILSQNLYESAVNCELLTLEWLWRIYIEGEMSNPYMNNRSYIGNMFIWLGIYMGIGLAISFVLPFPMSLLAMFGSLIGIDYLRARYMMKKMGITNIRQMFSSFSAPQTRDQALKYYCMSCGTEHRETSCPKCGSKMTRVGWW